MVIAQKRITNFLGPRASRPLHPQRNFNRKERKDRKGRIQNVTESYINRIIFFLLLS